MSAEERDYGKLAHAPAADRDWDDGDANHDREKDRHVRERQHETLHPSDGPDDAQGECVDETPNAQDHRSLRSENDAVDVRRQCCKPAGISLPGKPRDDFGCKSEAKRASEHQCAVHGEYNFAISTQREEARRQQQYDKSQHDQQTGPYPTIDH
jgi:hypothetical protein